MAAAVQAGDDVVIGFGSLAITGYVGEDGMKWKKGYNATEVTKAQDGSTRSKIRMDAYEELSGVLIADYDAGASPARTAPKAFAEGDLISLTPPGGGSAVVWEVQSCDTTLAAGATKYNIVLRKEASMTYVIT